MSVVLRGLDERIFQDESHLGHQVSAETRTGCGQAVHIVPLDQSPHNLVEGRVLQSRSKGNGEPKTAS